MVARLNGVQEAAGSNPVTRTKIRRTRESVSVLFWSSFCAAVRRIDPLRSNHWEGKPIPSQTHPMRVGGSCAQTEPAASCHFNQRPRSGLGGVHRRTGRWVKSSRAAHRQAGVERFQSSCRFGRAVRTPAASCISIIGRFAAVAASIAAAAAGSNPVTRTKNPRFRKKSGIFLA